jgi:hypothetical protein
MSHWTTFYGWVYTQVLRLCPRGFRADFGHEQNRTISRSRSAELNTGWTGSWLVLSPKLLYPLNARHTQRVVSTEEKLGSLDCCLETQPQPAHG